LFAKRVNGIIFNDSEFEVEYDICGTKSKTVKQTVSKDVSAATKVSASAANPVTVGG
jgi:hypothetical protein